MPAPSVSTEVIVQLRAGTSLSEGRALVRSVGGKVSRELSIINGLGAVVSPAGADALEHDARVRAVSANAPVQSTANSITSPSQLQTSFNQSVRADRAWSKGVTGSGVGVAVVDTGIAGGLPDFRRSSTDSRSRVIASVVVNPNARNAGDAYGHGTHVAGLIAGNGNNRPYWDPLDGDYVGAAPDANLISIKIADGNGNASLIDVIDGIQFAVEHKADYNIRVLNLSLNSSVAESYKTDPLDAAVEEAWFSGIVVVTAAGNAGTAGDAVSYSPANDPYVITVGAVDDRGSDWTGDDQLASWSSRGTTQDGLHKPEILAPGSQLVSTMSPGSAYTAMCPTCMVGTEYMRLGGTSMSAAVVSGVVADILENRPSWTPDQVKGALMNTARDVPGVGRRAADGRRAWASRPATPAALEHRPDAEHADRPGHREDRHDQGGLVARELPLGRRPALGGMEPLGELALRDLRDRGRGDRGRPERELAGELARIVAGLLAYLLHEVGAPIQWLGVSQPEHRLPERDAPWVMRTYAGHSTAKESNELYRRNLAKGQTGLSVAFDLPTQTGYDPDHELSRGEVGKVGVSIAHKGDMHTLLDGIPLDEMNTSMTINATAAWLLALYMTVAEENGVDRHSLQGTTQNDIIKEFLSRGTYAFPPEPSMRLIADMIAFTRRRGAALEPDQHLLVPPAGGRRHAGPGDRLRALDRAGGARPRARRAWTTRPSRASSAASRSS